jgi:hypothetical protein
MPSEQSFTWVTYIGNDLTTVTETSDNGGPVFTVKDLADGDDNGSVSTDPAGLIRVTYNAPLSGAYKYFDVYIIGWTPYGVLVENWNTGAGDPPRILLSNSPYSNTGDTISLNQNDPYLFCFLAGTEILTTKGPIKIEDLTLEDAVLTHDGQEKSIKWIGTQTVDNNIRTSVHRAPVKIARGALGHNLPSKDLFVTGSHAIYLNGQLINASVLVNGTTITQVSLKDLPDTFTYYHIETEAHEAIIANGLAAETFVDAPDRKAFDNYTEYVDTYGVERIIPEMEVPRITAVRHLPEDLRVSLGIEVEETDWAALVAESSTGLTLKQVG